MGKTKLNAGEREGRVRRSRVAPQETDAGWNLAGKPQPRGDTQIKRNGLTKDIRDS